MIARILISFAVIASLAAAAAKKPLIASMPDFTKGASLAEGASHDWTLGATGVRGWMFVSGKAEGHTLDSRQILITKVAPMTPAAGKLSKGDVLLGIGSDPFPRDARRVFAEALTRAEATDGRLELLRWRDGKTGTVTLELPRLGPWSRTAPYDCPKSAMILKQGCEVIAAGGLKNPSIPNDINALALLASGNPQYRQLLSDYAGRILAKPLDRSMSLACWSFAFHNLFLTEYLLATGDQRVLPEIKRLSGIIAAGQGVLGTWGHSFMNPETRRLNGYGAVNAVGLPLAISLVLAREAGANDPEISAAIDRSAAFFRRYVGLGAIPYGDHPPNLRFGHDDNGKNSAAAVLFDLLGDAASTGYFVRTAGAAFNADREQGHTGNFWNMLWALPAVSRGGPALSGAWLGEFGWYYDLARYPDGSFRYQGNPNQQAKNAYANWDCPGAWVLHFAVPKHAIRITGSKPPCIKPFDDTTVSSIIAAGNNDYPTMDAKALITSLSSWSPVVREAAATELAKRKIKGLEAPWEHLGDKDPLVRQGALKALEIHPGGSSRDESFAQSAALLGDPVLEVRVALAKCLIAMDRKRAAEVIFRYVLKHRNTENPVFSQIAVMELVPSPQKPDGALLASIRNRELVCDALTLLLNHEDTAVGARIVALVRTLPEDEQRRLLPDLLACAIDPPRGDVMFESGLTLGCLKVLADFHVREALPLVVRELTHTGWGRKARVEQAAKIIPSFGTHAQSHLPRLRETKAALDPKRAEPLVKVYDRVIDGIVRSSDTPKLISIPAN